MFCHKPTRRYNEHHGPLARNTSATLTSSTRSSTLWRAQEHAAAAVALASDRVPILPVLYAPVLPASRSNQAHAFLYFSSWCYTKKFRVQEVNCLNGWHRASRIIILKAINKKKTKRWKIEQLIKLFLSASVQPLYRGQGNFLGPNEQFFGAAG